jgi:hypothetical protein
VSFVLLLLLWLKHLSETVWQISNAVSLSVLRLNGKNKKISILLDFACIVLNERSGCVSVIFFVGSRLKHTLAKRKEKILEDSDMVSSGYKSNAS